MDASKLDIAERFNQTIEDRYDKFRTNIPELTGFEDVNSEALINAIKSLRASGMPSLKPLLPLMLTLKGKPYSIDDYFPFEPLFRTRRPKSIMIMSGRQVGKTQGLAAQAVMFHAAHAYFTTMFVTPLFEMIRRFSHQYIGAFIAQSPFKKLLVNKRCVNSVLKRSFINGANMVFSYAFLDADRTRGNPSDAVVIDETQDMKYEFLDIIFESLSGSPWRLKQFTGTPKSFSNTMNRLWEQSDQCQWAIKCHHGGCSDPWNIASVNYHLLDMIGPVRDDISEKEPGLICHACGKPLRPQDGHWLPSVSDPEWRWQFAGFHVPQCIMPMHYGSRERWGELVGKMQGRGGISQTTFFNEVLGEPWDVGAKVLTESELKAACTLPWPRSRKIALEQMDSRSYVQKIVSVDWGGGGGDLNISKASKGRARTSFTSLAVLGLRTDGRVDTIWGYRSSRSLEYEWEAGLVARTMDDFQCSHVVHDYNGAGVGRINPLRNAGLPERNIINVAYLGSGKKAIVNYVPPSATGRPHHVHQMDKSQSLVLTCQAIRYGFVNFFQYDHNIRVDERGLISDFLALMEEKATSKIGSDLFYIDSDPTQPDDFAQAVNMGCIMLWYMNKQWPDIGGASRLQLSAAMLARLKPKDDEADYDFLD